MATNNPSILAIDDNRDNLTSLQAVVADAFPGARVLTAMSGGKGIELALAEDPDVILLDIVMPGMDGFEVCRRLKDDKRLRHIPVVFLTALKTDRESRVKALEAGAEAFLSKPIEEAELTAQIRAMAKIKAANVSQHDEKERLAALLAERTFKLEEELAERRNAEEALLQSQERLRTVLDTTPFPMAVVDLLDNNILFWSLSALTIFGHTAPTASEWYQIAYPDPNYRREVIDRWKPFLEIARESRQTVNTGEYRVTCRDGSVRICELYATFLPDNLIVTFNDITERKRAEDELLHTSTLLNSIVENIPNMIFLKDAKELRFVLFNRAGEDLLGYSKNDLLGKNDYDFFPKEQADFFAEKDREVIRGKEVVDIPEEPLQTRNKGERTLHTKKVPILNAQGKPEYLLGISEDITERKQVEEEQRELEAQLRQSQKMEAMGTLAGGIAHDFNNILGIIMGHAEIAELKLAKDSPVKRYIDEVLKATNRAKDLVKQILTFSRKGEQERKPMQILPLIEDALKFLRASLPATIEIRPEIDLSPDDDLISGDPTQLQQILMNLSTNAAHAMHGRRGGTLRLALSPVYFSYSDVGKPLELDVGNYLKLTVEDSGHGMDRTTMDHIFEPFFTTKGPGEGTGLGLAVVHGIVTSHGGAITVSSRMGKGTAFQVFLPRLETGATAETEVIAELPGGTERILLVDDEEPLANAVKQLLEYLGYEVKVATSSAEALLAFRRQPEDFDLVITDYTMPKMTGTDLAEQILQIRPGIPIILCTGFSERINEEGAKKAGICAFLMKPGNRRDIALLVRKVLKNR
jgi:PAS domain S-box-containing protein